MKMRRNQLAVFQFLFFIFFFFIVSIHAAAAVKSEPAEKYNAGPSAPVDDPAAHQTPPGNSSQHQTAGAHGEQAHANIGERLPLWSTLPFACILLSIALFPLILPDFWHRHFGKISGKNAVNWNFKSLVSGQEKLILFADSNDDGRREPRITNQPALRADFSPLV